MYSRIGTHNIVFSPESDHSKVWGINWDLPFWGQARGISLFLILRRRHHCPSVGLVYLTIQPSHSQTCSQHALGLWLSCVLSGWQGRYWLRIRTLERREPGSQEFYLPEPQFIHPQNGDSNSAHPDNRLIGQAEWDMYGKHLAPWPAHRSITALQMSLYVISSGNRRASRTSTFAATHMELIVTPDSSMDSQRPDCPVSLEWTQ